MAKAKETKKAMSAEEKAAKKKARLEAIKIVLLVKDATVKQIDVIETEERHSRNLGLSSGCCS